MQKNKKNWYNVWWTRGVQSDNNKWYNIWWVRIITFVMGIVICILLLISWIKDTIAMFGD